MAENLLRIAGKELKLTNPDKVLYPETGFTKGELISYYRDIAPVLLPHMKGRPLTMKRYPNGVNEEFFFEKRCPVHRPKWVVVRDVTGEKESVPAACTVNNLPTLIWVANLASIELHTQLYRVTNTNRPTVMVFDLDPGPGAGMLDCIRVAIHLRDMLADAGLKSFPKTSGGKGLHFYVPLNTPATFLQTKTYSRAAAQAMEEEFPDVVVSKMSKVLRKGKVFIDWSQNDRHKTTVCVYSVRAHSRPAVSAPVTWQELENALKRNNVERLVFTPQDVLKRVRKHGDLFAEVLTLKQKLPLKERKIYTGR
jgi:bifunctional non-homologous end joining protein LigD